MIRRLSLAAALLAACVALALLARPRSRGMAVREAGAAYLEALAEGRLQQAHAMLAGSLGMSVAPGLLAGIAPRGPIPPARLAGREGDGYLVGFGGADGTTRTLQVALSADGPVIERDSRLEGLLGRAGDMCIGYARSTVAPQVLRGADPGDFECPVTGAPYGLSAEGGRLICPAGHLGEGVVLSADACSARRDSLAALAGGYLGTHDSLPPGFAAMYAGLDLNPWERVGYTCPADANVYYEILADSTVYCPYHGERTRIGAGP